MDQLSMHAAFFFIPFSDREWKTVNPDSDSKCNHPSWRKKMILDFCRLLNCSNCLLRFLWICTMIWFYSSLPKGKKNVWHVWLLESCVLMVLPSVQCFWEIIQLLAMCVLLIWRFHSCECYWPWGLLYWVMQYVTVIPVYKARYWDKDPPSPPHSIYFADGREGQENFGSCVSSSLISQCDNPGYFNYVYLSNTDYKGYSIERNVAWKMFIL